MNKFNNVIILIVLLLTTISCAQQDKSNSITMSEFKEQLKSNEDMVLLDVRTPEELAGPLGKIDIAINIPLQVLEQRINELEKFKDKEITVMCRTQNRSAVAVDILKKNGFKAKYVLGGMTEYRKN